MSGSDDPFSAPSAGQAGSRASSCSTASACPSTPRCQRRERFANRYDYEFGQERIFPAARRCTAREVPEGARLLEVGAATGLLTEPLLKRAGHLTALEPCAGMLRRLVAKDVAESPDLTVVQGMAEDLLHDAVFDVAVVTFTPRRGIGLLRLLHELASRVTDRVVMLLDEDDTFDWAYLARAAAVQGFRVSLRHSSSMIHERSPRIRSGRCSWSPTCAPGPPSCQATTPGSSRPEASRCRTRRLAAQRRASSATS